METASLSGTLRVILIIILVYYALRFLLRIFAPVIIQQVVKKAGQDFYEQQQYKQPRNAPETGNKSPRPAEKKKIGEYIDYEEIE
ncbi:hypothetical protein CHU92_10230 [Flavobacterium cyanobacteriorum]|uniref:DUF4834 domain-containing protein n=1 Tax=Flavobacterium cyanobacteriorum TaxID=2022802 RepID=A0A255Z3K1_9FLAO|nr:hypothetical protein [Flavobacterium cyanobacteriorum]OYQ36093.1 hypothetical protein CHU92_10230 [Flavobacterium cyanobacteriorum]